MRDAPDPTDYLHDIVENAEKVVAFTSGVDFDGFLADDMRAYATIRALEIIGEAVKQVSTELQKKYPGAPLRE